MWRSPALFETVSSQKRSPSVYRNSYFDLQVAELR